MKALSYISDKGKRAVLLRAFHIWQRRPHEVAPLSEISHECASCGSIFNGNFCPRCGQSAKVGRFSFKKAFLLFLDVWGVGNRGMFRSLRDLMFRPGYMIRDYISGMQSAYFPPFKMFFLLAALSLVVAHGFSLGSDGDETKTDVNEKMEAVKQEMKQVKQEVSDEISLGNKSFQVTMDTDNLDSPLLNKSHGFFKMMNTLRKNNPAIFSLLSLVIFSLPLYFFFRSTPTIPDLRYSEFIVALVYTSNMYSIYSIAGNLLNSSILKVIAFLMVFVALKQFSGYSKRRVLWYLMLTVLFSLVIVVALAALGVYIAYLTSKG
ncbi:Protein of unknown function [Xylanibacter ruminicola]|uniref:DUF3667 domain-containing protein n=1 Tax=Xylanibacter ruminicola TaxID=839 RepID=A0A1H5RPA0_XYLRU|nr:DUF3667 domain-containing protein [Xylanibacter ruminicola]SEF39934.1 Protein of unknown function [Xylanibacter ruminicola]